MATVARLSINRGHSFTAKHAMWLVFALMTLFVFATRERTLLDSSSFLRQRYSPFSWLLLAHAVPGALALFLGVIQFSSRFRERYRKAHRVMGRIYVGSVLISAPVAVAVSIALPLPTLLMATVFQSSGWLVATGIALHCVRTGRIQQHREWMMRGYPFAMVFVVARVLLAIPAIERMGVMGIATVVWSTLVAAGIVPSFLIAIQSLRASQRTTKLRVAQAAD